MIVDLSPARTPLTAVIAAILLAGCAYHSEYHAAGVAHRSIKDDPAPAPTTSRRVAVPQVADAKPDAPVVSKVSVRNSKPAPVALEAAPSTSGRMATSGAVVDPAPPTSKPAPAVARVDIAPPSRPVAPLSASAAQPATEPVVKPAAVDTAPTPKVALAIPAPAVTLPTAAPAVVAPPPSPPVKSTAVDQPAAPKAPAAIPAPAITLPAAPPAIVSAPVTPKPAASTDAPAPNAERTSTDLRRAAAVVAAAPPPAAPAAPAVTADPPPAKPAASAIIIQPKLPAPTAGNGAQPKVAALTDEQRVRDTIARANEYLSTKRLINARALLQDAARDDNPQLLTALAETFDPLVLRNKYPALARGAEPTRALDLYRRASERGSTAAAEKLKSLADFLAANPGIVKQ